MGGGTNAGNKLSSTGNTTAPAPPAPATPPAAAAAAVGAAAPPAFKPFALALAAATPALLSSFFEASEPEVVERLVCLGVSGLPATEELLPPLPPEEAAEVEAEDLVGLDDLAPLALGSAAAVSSV